MALSPAMPFAADPVYQAIVAMAARGEPLHRADDLAPALGLHPATVRRRITALADRGAIVIRPGRSRAIRRVIEVPGIGSTAPADTGMTRFLDWLADHPGSTVPQIAAGLGIGLGEARQLARNAWIRDRIQRAPGDGRPARYMLAGATPPPARNDTLDLPDAAAWAETWARLHQIAREYRARLGVIPMQVTMQTDRGIRITTTTDRAGAPVYCVELEVGGSWEVYSDHETPAAALMAATALVMDETATAA